MSFLSEHGGTLLLGSTAMLLVACIAIALSRVPVHQKRIGELAVWGVLAFGVLSTVPLPRLLKASVRTPDEPVATGPVTVVSPPAPVVTKQLLAYPADLEPALETRDPVSTTATAILGARLDAVPPVSGESGPTLLDSLVTIYLVGMAACLLWLLCGVLYLALLLARAKPAPRWVRDLLPEGDAPKVVVTPYRCRPFCLGWRRGRIVLPARLVHPERHEQLRQILLHEVGHLQQADLWGQLPLALLLPALFFNPLFWWVRARMRLASELLADDFAARRSTRTVYARELIALAEEDARHIPAPLGAACILRSPSEFYRRIKMLLEREETLSLRCSRWRNVLQTSVAAVLVAGLTSMGGVTAQDRVEETIRAIRKQLEVLQQENVALREELAKARRVAGTQFPTQSRPPSGFPRAHWLAPPRAVTVEKGDTFESLLSKNLVDPELTETVEILNPGLDPRKLNVGQEILLPGPAMGSTDPGLLKGLLADPKLARVLSDEESWRAFSDPDLPRFPGGLGLRGSSGNPVDPGLVGGVTADELPPGGGTKVEDPFVGLLGGEPATGLKANESLPGAAGLPQSQTYRGTPGPILDSATLQLMNQAIDLETEIENGEAELEHMESLVKGNFVTDSQLTQAKNSLRGTRRKHELILKMVGAEIQMTEQELQLLTVRRDQYAKDSTPYREVQAQIQRLHHRLELLSSVR